MRAPIGRRSSCASCAAAPSSATNCTERCATVSRSVLIGGWLTLLHHLSTSCAGLTRASIFFERRWIAGSSPAMTADGSVQVRNTLIFSRVGADRELHLADVIELGDELVAGLAW